jgi:hypothetical protein
MLTQEAGEKIQLKQEEEDFVKDQAKKEKMREEKQRFKEEQERKQKVSNFKLIFVCLATSYL